MQNGEFAQLVAEEVGTVAEAGAEEECAQPPSVNTAAFCTIGISRQLELIGRNGSARRSSCRFRMLDHRSDSRNSLG
jgi:hypothetical protein